MFQALNAWIVDGVRTPFGRYGGALAQVRADDLAALPISALRQRHPELDWGAIDDVVLGCANQAGEDNRNVARMAALLAGLPVQVTGTTLNRLCGSGLDAVASAARTLHAGEADLMLAGGAESMTRAPLVMAKADSAFSRNVRIEDTTIGWRFVNPRMQQQYGTDAMPETAENVASQLGISRNDQDHFALRSQQRWAKAHQSGFFREELIPVSVTHKDQSTLVSDDEHPRADTAIEQLARLKPIVRANGTITAGNASGVNDGAAALLLASEQGLRRHGLRARARIVGCAVSGIEPRIMGLGPVSACQKLLHRIGWQLQGLDVIELNEAFAAQALGVLRQLGVPDDAAHVNPNGGAIAIGHPLGASGARLVLTAVRQLEQTQTRRAMVTMCIGVGQGIAMAIERTA